MFIRCAWCGRMLGGKAPYYATSITHGMCAACAEKHFAVHPPASNAGTANPGPHTSMGFAPAPTVPQPQARA